MRHIVNPFVVVLDANVLYPFRIRDILLSFAQKGLFRARFTSEIIDEWTRSLIRDKPELKESIEEQKKAILECFEGNFVVGYESLIGSFELPDENDRHVVAAAVKCSAQHIVTENLKDFPIEVLEEYDVYPITADDFLSFTFDLYPMDSMSVLKALRERYDRPPFTPSEFLVDLNAKGLPSLAARARENIEFL